MKELLKEMIRINTVDSQNGDKIGELIKSYLDSKNQQYKMEIVEKEGVKNFIFTKGEKPDIALCGHYDVVPADDWPQAFEPVEKEGFIYGRGASDMKGGVVAAVEAFCGLDSVMLIVVGDEEKGGFKGAKVVVDKLKNEGRMPRAVIITEPGSQKELGDKTRVGARGVLFLKGVIKGRGGHASRPALADNPIVKLKKMIEKIEKFEGGGDDLLPPTTLTLTSLNADGGAVNVIPSFCEFKVDCRYNRIKNAQYVVEYLKEIKDVEIEAILDEKPFVNQDKKLTEAVIEACKEVAGRSPEPTAEGGSSDGRYFAWVGCGVAEIGAVCRNMHAKDECVAIEELEKLVEIVKKVVLIYRGGA